MAAERIVLDPAKMTETSEGVSWQNASQFVVREHQALCHILLARFIRCLHRSGKLRMYLGCPQMPQRDCHTTPFICLSRLGRHVPCAVYLVATGNRQLMDWQSQVILLLFVSEPRALLPQVHLRSHCLERLQHVSQETQALKRNFISLHGPVNLQCKTVPHSAAIPLQ